jgi:hypothetical protein
VEVLGDLIASNSFIGHQQVGLASLYLSVTANVLIDIN